MVKTEIIITEGEKSINPTMYQLRFFLYVVRLIITLYGTEPLVM